MRIARLVDYEQYIVNQCTSCYVNKYELFFFFNIITCLVVRHVRFVLIISHKKIFKLSSHYTQLKMKVSFFFFNKSINDNYYF